VPERDGAAVRADPPGVAAEDVEPQRVGARDDLRGERLGDLEDGDVLRRQPGLVEDGAHRRHRAEARGRRVDAARRRREHPQAGQPGLGPHLLGDDRDGRRAVVDAAGVPRGDRAAGREGRAEAGERGEREVGARPVVGLDPADRHQLVLEHARRPGRDGARVGALGVRVLPLAADAAEHRDRLGGLAHLRVRETGRRERRPGVEPRLLDRALGARHPPGRGARALDATGQHEVGGTAGDQRGAHPDRLQPRPALPVHGDAGHLDAEAGGQHRDPGDVAARPAAVAEDDVVHA
jgi:hypothetical protein